MILNLSFGPNQIKKNSILRIDGEQYKRIQGFPALYIDRYTYIGHVVVRARYGEPIQTNGGVGEHSRRGLFPAYRSI